jgi:hypothetical protein
MTATKVVLQDVRGSYVFVERPRKEKDGSDGKYSMQIILPKKHPQINAVRAAIKAAAVEKFGADVKMGMLKLPLRDGDEERDGDEYHNAYFINANSTRKPQIVNRRNEPAMPDDLEEYCYSGATFHVSINFYAFNYEGKKGVAAGLNNLMLRKKTQRLDGTANATSEFAELADAAGNLAADDDWGLDDEDDIPF